jgi:hypothetical protein
MGHHSLHPTPLAKLCSNYIWITFKFTCKEEGSTLQSLSLNNLIISIGQFIIFLGAKIEVHPHPHIWASIIVYHLA